jgi:hypothetical protein
MPYLIESTRPAYRGSRKNPNRKTEMNKRFCSDTNEMISAVSSESIDATRIVIIYLDEQEFAEKKK